MTLPTLTATINYGIEGMTTTDSEFVESQLNRMELRALIGMHSARAKKLASNLHHPEVRAEMHATSTRIGALSAALERLEQARTIQQTKDDQP